MNIGETYARAVKHWDDNDDSLEDQAKYVYGLVAREGFAVALLFWAPHPWFPNSEEPLVCFEELMLRLFVGLRCYARDDEEVNLTSADVSRVADWLFGEVEPETGEATGIWLVARRIDVYHQLMVAASGAWYLAKHFPTSVHPSRLSPEKASRA